MNTNNNNYGADLICISSSNISAPGVKTGNQSQQADMYTNHLKNSLSELSFSSTVCVLFPHILQQISSESIFDEVNLWNFSI